MANKQQISLSLAFVAVVVIFLTSQAKARREARSMMTATVANNRMLQSEAKARTGLEGKEDEFKKTPDGVISDPRLENFLRDMIETTRLVLHKSTKVGHSGMVQQCAKEFTFSLENLNKAMDLYSKGVKEKEGFKELTALVVEAEKSYKRCDQAFAVEYKPSPFSVYDTWLENLAKNAEKQSNSVAEKV